MFDWNEMGDYAQEQAIGEVFDEEFPEDLWED